LFEDSVLGATVRQFFTPVFLVLFAFPAFARPASEPAGPSRVSEHDSSGFARWESPLAAAEADQEPALVWTTSRLRGSRASLIGQNAEIDRLQLTRIEDEQELKRLIRNKELVPIRNTSYLRVDPRLDSDRRYCRQWVLTFLQDMGSAFQKKFRGKLQVNSAVRTVEQQRKLLRTNRNAAPIEGDTASSHLAGVTVDIAKKGLSYAQIKWIRNYLLEMKELGLVEAVEERWQAVFHIMVSERYAEWREQRQVAGNSKAGSK
jgi:uncharacterized protein YcbK (DUF882 family)